MFIYTKTQTKILNKFLTQNLNLFVFKDGSEVRQERGKITLSGRLNIQFSNTIRSDAGTYRCVVQHAGGIITRNYTIEVKGSFLFSLLVFD